jgi:hypothetical protein
MGSLDGSGRARWTMMVPGVAVLPVVAVLIVRVLVRSCHFRTSCRNRPAMMR